jgi:hypothetical protein
MRSWESARGPASGGRTDSHHSLRHGPSLADKGEEIVYETRRLDPARAAGPGGTQTVEALHLRPSRTGPGFAPAIRTAAGLAAGCPGQDPNEAMPDRVRGSPTEPGRPPGHDKGASVGLAALDYTKLMK